MVGVMALFARIVSRLFDTHYSIACHAVIGIVLASTLIIIPTDFASTAEMVWSVACAILGAVLEKVPVTTVDQMMEAIRIELGERKARFLEGNKAALLAGMASAK